jgi:hypothetical protein
MPKSTLLRFGNPRSAIEHIRPLLDPQSVAALETHLRGEVAKLYALSLHHYRFAASLTSTYWRQRVSRLYYAAYASSRALRLAVSGEYSTEVTDHKKVGSLPDDFPSRARFSANLDVLREDRNSCDYDHGVSAGELAQTTANTEALVRDFLIETRAYLVARGINLRGKP